jgi:hypothetical protein
MRCRLSLHDCWRPLSIQGGIVADMLSYSSRTVAVQRTMMRVALLVAAGSWVSACAGGLFFDRSPFLQQLTSDSVWVVSQTESQLSATLRWGRSGEVLAEIGDAAPTRDHLFFLSGLDPDTEYEYEVTQGEMTRNGTFRTLPAPGGEITVAVIGDSGYRTGENAGADQDAVRDLLLKLDANLVLHTGDISYDFGLPGLYQSNFFDVYEESLATTPWFPCPDNHDGIWGLQYYRDAFHLPLGPTGDEFNYSFDAGDAHFVSLNSSAGFPDEVLDWLEADLEATPRRWKIVYFHEPPYSNGYHGGTVFITTGGGGATLSEGDRFEDDALLSPQFSAFLGPAHHAVLVRITPSLLTVEAHAVGGSRIDRRTIRKDGTAPPPLEIRFGDANESGEIDIADAVSILSFLFIGQADVCTGAADVERDGDLGIDDAIRILTCLFLDPSGWDDLPPGCVPTTSVGSIGCRGYACD